MSTAAASASTGEDAPGASPVRVRNRRGEGARLRPQILAAAAELLDESGSEEAVTLRAVARRAGIAAPSIYAHFADRQAILLAIVQDAFADLTRRLDEAAQDADPVARLRALCAAYLDFAATRPQRYKVMFGGAWSVARALEDDAISQSDADALGQDTLGVFVGALQACADAGRSTSSDPVSDAVALWVGLHGLAYLLATSSSFPWPADITERIVDPLAHLVPEA